MPDYAMSAEKQMQSALDAGAKLPLNREYVTSEARDLPSTPSDLPDALKTSFAEKPMQKDLQELPVEAQKAGAEGASNKLVTNLLQFRGETAGSSFTANNQNFAGVAPDPTICASSRYLISVVNSVISIRDATSGTNYPSYPKSLTAFFNEKASNATGFSGPKCVYDSLNKRFILSVFLKWGPANTVNAFIYIAITATDDPTGLWRTYLFNGSGRNDGCRPNPCYPGSPSLGQNRETFMISADLFNPQGVQITPKLWVCPKIFSGAAISCRTFSGYSSRQYQVSNVEANNLSPPTNGKAYLVGPFFADAATTTTTNLVTWVIDSATIAGITGNQVAFTTGYLFPLAFSVTPNQPITQANGQPTSAGDTRATCLNWVGNFLYTAFGTVVNGKASMLFVGLDTSLINGGAFPVKFQGTYTPPSTLGLAFPSVTANLAGAPVWTASLTGTAGQQYAAAAGGIDPDTGRVNRVFFFTQTDSNVFLRGPLVNGVIIAGSYSGATMDETNTAWMISQQGQNYSLAYPGNSQLQRNWGTIIWKLQP